MLENDPRQKSDASPKAELDCAQIKSLVSGIRGQLAYHSAIIFSEQAPANDRLVALSAANRILVSGGCLPEERRCFLTLIMRQSETTSSLPVKSQMLQTLGHFGWEDRVFRECILQQICSLETHPATLAGALSALDWALSSRNPNRTGHLPDSLVVRLKNLVLESHDQTVLSETLSAIEHSFGCKAATERWSDPKSRLKPLIDPEEFLADRSLRLRVIELSNSPNKDIQTFAACILLSAGALPPRAPRQIGVFEGAPPDYAYTFGEVLSKADEGGRFLGGMLAPKKLVCLGLTRYDPARLAEVLLACVERGLTHLALPFPDAHRQGLEDLLAGRGNADAWVWALNGQGMWHRWYVATSGAEASEASRLLVDGELRQVQSMVAVLKALQGKVDFVFYGTEQSDRTDRSQFGELYLDAVTRPLIEAAANPRNRVLLVGDLERSAKSHIEGHPGYYPSFPLTLEVRKRSNLRTESVHYLAATEYDLMKDLRLNDLATAVELARLKCQHRTVGLHLDSSISRLRFSFTHSACFQDAWEALVLEIPREKGGGDDKEDQNSPQPVPGTRLCRC